MDGSGAAIRYLEAIPPGDLWQPYLRGQGLLERVEGDALRLALPAATHREYGDAQIDDYQDLRRSEFLWQAPATLTVHARFSHGPDRLLGTAGFGFWNDPVVLNAVRRPTLPRAAWFFYASPPSDMQLARDVPGHGWKAATIDATGWRPLALLPVGLLALPWLWSERIDRRIWPFFQRSLRICEAPVDVDMTAWHVYRIEWQPARVRFLVDERVVLDCALPPRGRMGAVIWLDNQYAVVTRRGRLGWGLLDIADPQWLELRWLELSSISVHLGE